MSCRVSAPHMLMQHCVEPHISIVTPSMSQLQMPPYNELLPTELREGMKFKMLADFK